MSLIDIVWKSTQGAQKQRSVDLLDFIFGETVTRLSEMKRKKKEYMKIFGIICDKKVKENNRVLKDSPQEVPEVEV